MELGTRELRTLYGTKTKKELIKLAIDKNDKIIYLEKKIVQYRYIRMIISGFVFVLMMIFGDHISSADVTYEKLKIGNFVVFMGAMFSCLIFGSHGIRMLLEIIKNIKRR